MSEPTPSVPAADPPSTIPPGIRRALAAIRRDLPELLANRRNRGKCVCYWLERRIGINRSSLPLVREINRLNVPDDEFVITILDEHAGLEEIDYDEPPPKVG